MKTEGWPTHSALYEGKVTHLRTETPSRRFEYRLAMCYLDLDEIDAVFSQHPLWSRRRGSPVQFRRSDYLGDPDMPLATSVRATISQETHQPIGPIRVLTHLRTWGWCFNPISLYFCFDPSGTSLNGVVASVTNTPWRQRYDYVLPVNAAGSVDYSVTKSLHVSPFLGMEQRHRFVVGQPADRLDCTVESYQDERRCLRADLHLRRRRLDRRAMSHLLIGYPLMTWRVSSGIYAQAARLALKGATFHPHPQKAVQVGKP
jgi:DUF1365 family protein